MKNNIISKVLNVVMLAIVLILLWQGCELKKEKQNLLSQVSEYKLGDKAYRNRIMADSSTISTQSQTILNQKEAIRLGLLQMDGEIKKAQSQVRQRQEVVIKEVEVPYIPHGYTDTTGWYKRLKSGEVSKEVIDSMANNCILVNTGFKKDDKWYAMSGTIQKKGIAIDTFKLSNESDVTIGYKRSGFLGLKKEPIVEVKNTNPYLSVSKLNNVVIKKDKSIFENKLFWTGIGTLIGILLGTKL